MNLIPKFFYKINTFGNRIALLLLIIVAVVMITQPPWLLTILLSTSIPSYHLLLIISLLCGWVLLWQRYQQLKQFLDALPVGVSVFDKRGQLCYSNRRLQQLLGQPTLLTSVESSTQRFYLAGSQRPYPPAHYPWQRAAQGESLVTDDIELHRDNCVISLSVSAYPLLNSKEQVRYALTTFQDITAITAQLKQALADKEHLTIALQDSQANLADVQRMAMLGSWIWDIQEGHFWMSAQNCRNLGFSMEQQVLTYSESLHYVHPDDKMLIGTMVGTCLQQRQGVEFIFRVNWPHDQTRTLLSRHELECDSAQRPKRLKGFTQDITERKQAEEALASREAYLATLVELQYCLLAFEDEQLPYEHILALLSSATQATRIVFFDNEIDNQGQWVMKVKAQWALESSVIKIPPTLPYYPLWLRWAALFTQDELVSGFIDEFPEPERQVLLSQGVTSLLALPLKVNNEFSGFIRFDNCGHNRFWSASEIVLLWAAAAAISLTQEQQQIKAALTESQQRFATVLDSIQALIYVADMNSYEVLFINQYGRQLFGNIEGQLCWQTLQTGQTGPCSFCTNAYLLKANGQPSDLYSWEFENTQVQRWYDIHDQAIPWTDGRIVRLEIATDVTERKHAEQALRDSEARYRLLAEYATDLISRHTLDGVFLYASPACQTLLGYEATELLGLNAYDFFHPEDIQKLKHSHSEMIKKTEPLSGSYRIRQKNGQYIWFETTSQIVHTPEPEIIAVSRDISQRKHIEAALRQSEERFELAMQGASDGLWDWNRLTDEVYYSPRWKQMLGFTESEVGNSPDEWLKRIHPADRNQALADAQAYFDKCKPNYELNFRMQHKQGHYLWILSRGIAVWDQHSRPVRVVGTYVDMTAQRQAEGALRAQQTFLRLIIDNIPQYIFWKDTQGVYLGCNQSNAECAQLHHPNDIIGKTDFDLPWRRHAQDIQDFERHIMTSETPEYRFIEQFSTTEGQVHWLETNRIPLYDSKGCVVGILGTAEDITERKNAEDKLYQAHVELHQFKTTLDMTLDSVFMFDAETLKFFYVNQGAMNQLGYSEVELLQMTLFDLDAQVSVEGSDALASPVQRYETQHRHKNGQLIAVEVFIQYITIEKQKDRFVALVRDITERKQVEEKLRQAKEAAEVANRAKSTFVANMSHELRTPLNGILGYTQILIRDKSLTDKQKQGIEIIQRSGEHLLMLINDILDLSKIEAGKLEVIAHDFCLPEFLENITELMKMHAEQKNISFQYKALTPLPTGVHADEKRVRQIILNLLSNAIKFTDQGSVCVRVSYQHSMMRCEVEDTGSGISEAELENIFLPFQQVGDQSRHMEGTGLGLFITQRLVIMMGGSLNVNSRLNQGSCFWFELPMIAAPYFTRHRPGQTIISGYRSAHQAPFKILVVDDSQPNRAVLVNLLSELGFELAQATNGQEALAKAQTLGPDLILMDLVMPVMDGFELARQLRQADPPLNQVIIIANSASVFDFHQNDSLAAGCNAFLPKPIRAEALLALLQQHLPLEWLEDTSTSVAEAAQNPELAETLDDLIRPSPAQTEALLRLVASGSIRRITAKIDELEQENPQLATFSQIARQLIKKFEMNKLKKFIQADPIDEGDSDS